MGVRPLEQLFLRKEVLLESQTMCNVLFEFHTNIRQRKVLWHPNTSYQTTLRQNTVSCLACRTLGTGTVHFHYLNISYIKLFLRIHVTSLSLILMKSIILWWINLIKTSCFGFFFSFQCSVTCGNGVQRRGVVCQHFGKEFCDLKSKPITLRSCNTSVLCFVQNGTSQNSETSFKYAICIKCSTRHVDLVLVYEHGNKQEKIHTLI